MSSFPPSSGGWPPRSTPIPGEPIQGSPVDDSPPTPGEFLGSGAGPKSPPNAGYPQTGHPQAGYPQAGYPQMGVPSFGQPAVTKRSRNWGGTLLMLIVVGGVLAGIGAAVWGVMKAKDSVDRVTQQANEQANDAVDRANELSDPSLSDNDRAALGLTGNEQSLFEGAAAAAVTAAMDEAIIGEPTNFTQILLYSDYAFATAQNPTALDHLDDYGWRLGEVSASTPQPNDADAPSKVFTVADVDWTAVGAVIADAVRVSNVENGKVSHVIATRNSFAEGMPVVVRVYVSGPRSSAYIEVAPDGTVIAVH
ncbi:MAG: hypothetical protein Q7V88_11520 [Actinomycetota bacterium]|nr:hypothetical protein [Actinomycetota bacterium]